MITSCYCGTSLPYETCCEPFHLEKSLPKTAEQLMRSRYSAYVLRLIEYIVNTTLPTQQATLDKTAIREWSEGVVWQGLKVLKHKNLVGTNRAKVEFEAYYLQDGISQVHHENSSFVKIKGRWYFEHP